MKVPQQQFGFWTATAVIIANMVGTGVFATLGYQLLEFESGFLLMLLWAAGGLAALCGAMSYAELGAAFPRSGGEYNFLGRIYHPAAGFVSGWVSATIGFAAPTAAVALAFGAYLTAVVGDSAPAILPKLLACGLVISLALVHARDRNSSSVTQIAFTAIKIVVIVGFCLVALLFGDSTGDVQFAPQAEDTGPIFSGSFAVALIYVVYAYTGWNAATYLTGELEKPQQSLPRILLVGTLVVTVLYLALNFVFLMAPVEALRGQTDIGYIAARHLFGEGAAKFTGVIIAVLLISSVSAMSMAGPRVLHAIGEDYPFFQALGKRNEAGVPARAILLQAAIAVFFIVTSTFQFILIFASFTVALNSFLAVLGLFVLRLRQPDLPRPYRVTLYPLTPLIYLALTAWMLVYVLIDKTEAGLFALSVVAAGLVVYALLGRQKSA